MTGFLITLLEFVVLGVTYTVHTLLWLGAQDKAYRARRARRLADEHYDGVRAYFRSPAAQRALKAPTCEMPQLAGRTTARPIMPPRLPVPKTVNYWPLRPERWMAWPAVWVQPTLGFRGAGPTYGYFTELPS